MSSKFIESEEKAFTRLINHRPLWKDRMLKGQDTISNGVCIEPFQTLSSYHLWMRRNLILNKAKDEYIYISGSNVIFENYYTKKQTIIPIKNDCEVTSLYFQIASTGEKLLFVGEKVSPNEYNERISGRIEIINLDKKILPEKIKLDLGEYVNFDSYVYDCIAPANNDYCFVVLRNMNINDKKSKIFTYNFRKMEILDIDHFNNIIEGISVSTLQSNRVLIFSEKYLSIWKFEVKRNFVEDKTIYNGNTPGNDKITSVAYVRYGKTGVACAFNTEWLELYEAKVTKHKPDEDINQSDVDYILFLRVNLFSFFKENWVKVEKNDLLEGKVYDKPEMSSNFMPFDPKVYNPNFGQEKPKVKAGINTIKYIISRNKYLFLFIERTHIVMVLEFVETENNNYNSSNEMETLNDNDKIKVKVKVSSIDKLEDEITKNCSIDIGQHSTRMFISNGTSIFKLFSALLEKKGKDATFEMKKVELTYNSYKIIYVDGSPSFEFEESILKNTGLGFPVKRLLLSETPKILIVNNGPDDKDLYFYKQIQTSNEEAFRKQKASSDGGTNNNFIHTHTKFYKENTSFENFTKTSFDGKILNIAFSPLGKCFFVSKKENGFLYALLGSELREVFKIPMYCRACTFDETGTYFAFSTSELDNDYNIYVLNLITYDYEFVLTKLPCPTKLLFTDGSKILIAQFNDNSTNLLGWKLHWSKRLIENKSISTKDKNSDKTEENEEEKNNQVLKIKDFSGTITDFCYDPTLGHLLVTSADKRQRIDKFAEEEKDQRYWVFASDIEYPKCVLVKKYDSIIFGTQKGSLRACLWPISGLGGDISVEHPEFNETFLHAGKITSIVVSADCNLIYSSGEDGSIFISCISSISNDTPVNMNSFIYFDQKNFLPKKVYYDYKDVMYITDQIYDNKSQNLTKKKSNIQSMISEFISNKEKIISQNAGALENERTQLTSVLQEKVDSIKKIETEKETQTKILKRQKAELESDIAKELNNIKKEFKQKKDERQKLTQSLIKCIKDSKDSFKKKKEEIEQKRDETNTKIKQGLDNMYQLLLDKKEDIDRLIAEREKKFSSERERNEEIYEKELRDKEKKHKQNLEYFESKMKENENSILKKQKDNKNDKEKLIEWDNHLKELTQNNQELMETYIFNTLKLNQMNQLLSENEAKISSKEKVVKDKRLVNDRLEQLRFVLEYQIKNLILEKTPIEEQIKNFESLHSDFYKRFNLLYAELLNISDLIQNNEDCIKNYREELAETKKKLYMLKNLYKSIDVALNSILKNKLDSKKVIIESIFNVYTKYLKNFSDDKKQENIQSPEIKLQTKNIEKEIYHQKNNVLKELIEKRSERKRIILEKEEMMKDIRLDNQLLIQECSNIRENLEDILKNINDIEKKFIELTNNNAFLGNDENVEGIEKVIKKAKNNILLHEADKVRVSKLSTKEKVDNMDNNMNIGNIQGNMGNNMQYINLEPLVRKQMEISEEMGRQDIATDKMVKKIKEVVGGENVINDSGNYDLNNQSLNSNNVGGGNEGNNGNGGVSIGNLNALNEQMKNLENSRKLSIKSKKYIDASDENAIK